MLRDYGKAIGLCFQIIDDILDKIGDIDKLGKDIGSDDENKKATYLTFYGLEESIKTTQQLYEEALNHIEIFKDNDISFFIELAKYLVYRES